MKPVRGHDAAWTQFAAAWKHSRLGQAYLFTGPPGVGKAMFAKQLARAVLCETMSDELIACGTCVGCRQMAAGTHPDFLFCRRPDDKLELPIELIRDLCDHLALKPARGSRKVAVLDDADDLNDSSANAFLKTLEEPPAGSLLILVGGDPQRQLATVVSRCQVIHFRPLATELLIDILLGEGVEGRDQAEKLARLSGGSVETALALNDPEVWAFRDHLAGGLSKPRPDFMGLARDWSRFCEDAGKDAAARRRRCSLVMRLLIAVLRRRVCESLEGGGDTDRLLGWVGRCLDADRHLDRRVQIELVVESLLDAMSKL